MSESIRATRSFLRRQRNAAILAAWRHRGRIVRFQTAGLLLVLSVALLWLYLDEGWLEPITLALSTALGIGALWLHHVAPPIDQLSEREIRRLITTSDPFRDWRTLTIYDEKVSAFEHDAGLRIVMKWTDESEEFANEPWMSEAWAHSLKRLVHVERKGITLFQIFVVGVDGSRAYLPLPNRRDDKRVTALQDVIVRVINKPDDPFYSYDKYVTEAGFSVVDSDDLKVTPYLQAGPSA